ncbi:MAG: 6,7-dimethyl-8-ribityllumazine synthase [bacterium]
MATILEGKVDGSGKRFGIVVSRFNSFVSERLLEGCLDCLHRHGVSDEDITIARVPGSFEIPLIAKKLVQRGELDAVIAVGAVIRGATPHFDYVAGESAKGVAMVTLETGMPIVYGIVTADTIEQAVERAGTKAGNKGWDAAMAAMELVNLIDQM